MLAIARRVYIWKVSPQLSRSATCQIKYECDSKNQNVLVQNKKILIEKLANGALVTPTTMKNHAKKHLADDW